MPCVCGAAYTLCTQFLTCALQACGAGRSPSQRTHCATCCSAVATCPLPLGRLGNLAAAKRSVGLLSASPFPHVNSAGAFVALCKSSLTYDLRAVATTLLAHAATAFFNTDISRNCLTMCSLGYMLPCNDARLNSPLLASIMSQGSAVDRMVVLNSGIRDPGVVLGTLHHSDNLDTRISGCNTAALPPRHGRSSCNHFAVTQGRA